MIKKSYAYQQIFLIQNKTTKNVPMLYYKLKKTTVDCYKPTQTTTQRCRCLCINYNRELSVGFLAIFASCASRLPMRSSVMRAALPVRPRK